MAMAPLKVKAALTVVLLLLLAASTLVVSAEEESPPSSAVHHFIHTDAADGDLSRPEALSSVPAAAASTTGTDGDTKTYSGWAMYEGGEYLMEVGIGAPDNKVKAVADTGSDVTWTLRKDLCDPATCPSDQSQQDCKFRKVYGNLKLGATGFMAHETLFFFPSSSSKGAGGESAPVSVPVDLGCAEKCYDDKGGMDCHKLIPGAAEGIIGLNRGPKSLVRKLGATRLSYCIQSGRTTQLWIGGAKLSLASAADVQMQKTPLVGHAGTDLGSVWANKYYVKLEGVSVTTATTTTAAAAAPPVSIPGEAFNHRSDDDVEGKKGVMFVDSGCTYSKLETAAFNVVKNLLANELNAEPFRNSSNWTCFKVQYNTAADANNIFVNLHLAKDRDGATATMSLGWKNFMQPGDEEGSSSCLAIKDSGQSISVLGNFQQQKIHMLYDLVVEKLFFGNVQDCSASNIKLID